MGKGKEAGEKFDKNTQETQVVGKKVMVTKVEQESTVGENLPSRYEFLARKNN